MRSAAKIGTEESRRWVFISFCPIKTTQTGETYWLVLLKATQSLGIIAVLHSGRNTTSLYQTAQEFSVSYISSQCCFKIKNFLFCTSQMAALFIPPEIFLPVTNTSNLFRYLSFMYVRSSYKQLLGCVLTASPHLEMLFLPPRSPHRGLKTMNMVIC